MSKIINVIIAVAIYICLGQIAIGVVPKAFLSDYVFSHATVIVLYFVALIFLKAIFNSKVGQTLNINSVIAYSIVAVVLCVAINYPFNVINGLHNKPNEYNFFLSYGLFGQLCFLVLLGALGPIVEELFFRYYIYNMVKEEFGISLGIFVSAFLYMILHNFKIQILYLFIPGAIYAVLYEKTKTIWSSIVVHSLNNLIWFYFIYQA